MFAPEIRNVVADVSGAGPLLPIDIKLDEKHLFPQQSIIFHAVLNPFIGINLRFASFIGLRCCVGIMKPTLQDLAADSFITLFRLTTILPR